MDVSINCRSSIDSFKEISENWTRNLFWKCFLRVNKKKIANVTFSACAVHTWSKNYVKIALRLAHFFDLFKQIFISSVCDPDHIFSDSNTEILNKLSLVSFITWEYFGIKHIEACDMSLDCKQSTNVVIICLLLCFEFTTFLIMQICKYLLN